MSVVHYLDTSAILKRAFLEGGSSALRAALDQTQSDGAALITSALTRVEAGRALRRREAELAGGADRALRVTLQGVGQAPVTGVVLELARSLEPPALRSLDAIHLATAIALGARQVWTYDERLADAAALAGLAVRTPV